MGLTTEQLAARRLGIGGSEIAALLGEDQFSGPLDVWLSKVHGWVRPENEDMRRGTHLEAGIAEWAAERMGWDERTPGSVLHATCPVARCTPDRLVCGDTGPQALLSIKAPRRGGWHWGEDGSSDVPPGYALQLQWEHSCVSSREPVSSTLYLAALLDGDLRIYKLAADIELQAWMLEYAVAWWRTYVEPAKEPPLVGAGARAWLRTKFATSRAEVRAATPSEDVTMLRLREAERVAARAEEDAEAARLELMQAIGSAGGLESPAGRVTWRADKNSKRIFRAKWKE